MAEWTEVLTDARAALGDFLNSELAPKEWDRVLASARELREWVARRDAERVAYLVGQIENGLARVATDLDSNQAPTSAPQPVMDEINEMIHAVDLQLLATKRQSG